MKDTDKIRVQFEDFKISYFDITQIWEFAIDEEGDDDQDETTLKPRTDLTVADPSQGLFMIQCKFATPTGKTFHGICHPTFENSISSIQPYIFTDKGLVMFWCGAIKPTQNRKDSYYNLLNESSDSLFPLKFESTTPTVGANMSGLIEGFMWFTFADRNKILVEK